jgi:transposase-like protein
MAETRRKFDHDFREGAMRLVRETGKPIAEVARGLGINAGMLGNWVNVDKRRRGLRPSRQVPDGPIDEAADPALRRALRPAVPRLARCSRELARVTAGHSRLGPELGEMKIRLMGPIRRRAGPQSSRR